jgi:hypothetical protein
MSPPSSRSKNKLSKKPASSRQRTTGHCIPEDITPPNHRCENLNSYMNIEVDCTVESSNGLEIYVNCGRLMGRIFFHLRVHMTSQQYSRFEVSRWSSDLSSGSEIVCVQSHEHLSAWQHCNYTPVDGDVACAMYTGSV